MSNYQRDLEELKSGNSVEPDADEGASQAPSDRIDTLTARLGSPINPNMAKSSAPRKMYAYAAVGAVALGVIFWLKHNADVRRDAVVGAQRVAQAQVRAGKPAPQAGPVMVDLALDSADRAKQARFDKAHAAHDSAVKALDPDSLALALHLPPKAPKAPKLAGGTDTDLGVIPNTPAPQSGTLARLHEYQPIETGSGKTGKSDSMPGISAAESQRLEREAEAQQAREAAAAKREKEDAQLAAEATVAAEGGKRSGSHRSADAGDGSDDAVQAPSLGQAIARAGGAAAAAATGTSALEETLVPGTKVRAVLTVPFNSATADVGVIQARLATALKDRSGHVVLPAGTIAYGSATVREAANATPRVLLTFKTFVLPNQETVRGITASAYSASSDLAGLEGSVDRHLVARVGKAVVAEGLALAATSRSTSTRTVYEVPTAREQMTNDMSTRLNAIATEQINPSGEVKNDVSVGVNTPFVLKFGLPKR